MSTVLPLAMLILMCSTPAALAQPVEGDETLVAQAVLRRARDLARLEPGVRARLIDPELAADPRMVGALDAFVVREAGGQLRPTIYVNCRSPLVARAAAGDEVDVIALAAVLHHEAQHLRGASEADARRAETAFFKSELRRARIGGETATGYLRLLSYRDAHGSGHATQD